MNDTLLIAGGGQAGFSVASKLRKLGDDRPITIICGEIFPPYQRPPLSKKYLLGETKKERLLKDLKGTREQRKRRSEDAKTNFSSWLRQLDNEEYRKREEESMEVNRLAADKALETIEDNQKEKDKAMDISPSIIKLY